MPIYIIPSILLEVFEYYTVCFEMLTILSDYKILIT